MADLWSRAKDIARQWLTTDHHSEKPVVELHPVSAGEAWVIARMDEITARVAEGLPPIPEPTVADDRLEATLSKQAMEQTERQLAYPGDDNGQQQTMNLLRTFRDLLLASENAPNDQNLREVARIVEQTVSQDKAAMETLGWAAMAVIDGRIVTDFDGSSDRPVYIKSQDLDGGLLYRPGLSDDLNATYPERTPSWHEEYARGTGMAEGRHEEIARKLKEVEAPDHQIPLPPVQPTQSVQYIEEHRYENKHYRPTVVEFKPPSRDTRQHDFGWDR
jgi:hypothetical protein